MVFALHVGLRRVGERNEHDAWEAYKDRVVWHIKSVLTWLEEGPGNIRLLSFLGGLRRFF